MGRLLAGFAVCCACAERQQVVVRRPVPRSLVDPDECAGEAARECLRKGRVLLESRRAEWAQASMEYIDKACAADLDEACDLAALAFKAPRRIAGRNPQFSARVQLEHIRGTVVVRCVLDPQGRLQDCAVVESVLPEMAGEVLDSLATRRYEPATWGGNPVAVPFDVRIDVSP